MYKRDSRLRHTSTGSKINLTSGSSRVWDWPSGMTVKLTVKVLPAKSVVSVCANCPFQQGPSYQDRKVLIDDQGSLFGLQVRNNIALTLAVVPKLRRSSHPCRRRYGCGHFDELEECEIRFIDTNSCDISDSTHQQYKACTTESKSKSLLLSEGIEVTS